MKLINVISDVTDLNFRDKCFAVLLIIFLTSINSFVKKYF